MQISASAEDAGFGMTLEVPRALGDLVRSLSESLDWPLCGHLWGYSCLKKGLLAYDVFGGQSLPVDSKALLQFPGLNGPLSLTKFWAGSFQTLGS